MSTYWYSGRGKSGRGDTYWLKRNNIQSWVNRTGCLSIPAGEIKRIRKNRYVGFFDLRTHDKYVTDTANFLNAEEVDGQVAVDIRKFNCSWRDE